MSLFGDVWERPGLSKRDRSLITCAALVALNRTEQQLGHFSARHRQRRHEGRAHRADHASCLLFRLADRHVGGQRRQESVRRGREEVKLCYFNDYRLGVIKGDQRRRRHRRREGHPASRCARPDHRPDRQWDNYKAKVEKAATDGKGVPLQDVRLRPPVPKPGNIVCMAVNYMEDGTLKEKPADQRLPQGGDGGDRRRRHDGAARRAGLDLRGRGRAGAGHRQARDARVARPTP